MKALTLNGSFIGRPVNRVDGRAKVTGAARYSAEEPMPAMAHGVMVSSAIAQGRVKSIDARQCEEMAGVLLVLTHENRGDLAAPPNSMAEGLAAESRPPLEDDRIYYAGQYIAMVLAETLEQAQDAAHHLNVVYDAEPHVVKLEDAAGSAYRPKMFESAQEELQISRGDVQQALADAAVIIDQTYRTPWEHPNPMEPHATIAFWDNGGLTVRNATQWVLGNQGVLSKMLKMPANQVRILAPYVGGMFGSKAATGGYIILTAIAARQLGRPVKTVLTREQVMTTVGGRAETVQRFQIGGDSAGKLTAMRHEVLSPTSIQDEFAEPCNITSRMLYDVPNYEGTHELRRVNTMKPAWMRAPGEATCQFAQEVALDELAYAMNVDPVELRQRNHAAANPQTGKPFSSKNLLECYTRGADRFGWSRKDPRPGSMRDGLGLVGMGMATATYPGYRFGAAARVRLHLEGSGVRAVVSSATSDAGTGMYTLMALTAAEALGLPIERITPELGDSSLPPSAMAGGSNLTASVSPAVYEACEHVRKQLCQLAVGMPDSPVYRQDPEKLSYSEGRLFVEGSPERGISYAEVLAASGKQMLEAQAQTQMMIGQKEKYAFQSFGAQFAEVRVDPDLHTVRVARLTGVFDIGRVVNAKAARSQAMGGMVFGIGMALLEDLVWDPVAGRAINADLGDYLVPVNADVPEMDISFIDKPDLEFGPLGCRGVGEIGNTGLSAAIANAVFHATGKRVRDLPITPERLMARPAA